MYLGTYGLCDWVLGSVLYRSTAMVHPSGGTLSLKTSCRRGKDWWELHAPWILPYQHLCCILVVAYLDDFLQRTVDLGSVSQWPMDHADLREIQEDPKSSEISTGTILMLGVSELDLGYGSVQGFPSPLQTRCTRCTFLQQPPGRHLGTKRRRSDSALNKTFLCSPDCCVLLRWTFSVNNFWTPETGLCTLKYFKTSIASGRQWLWTTFQVQQLAQQVCLHIHWFQ